MLHSLTGQLQSGMFAPNILLGGKMDICRCIICKEVLNSSLDEEDSREFDDEDTWKQEEEYLDYLERRPK